MGRSLGFLIVGGIAVLSVSANLFLLGVAFGDHFRRHGGHFGLDGHVYRLWERLPVEDQPVAKAAIEHHRDEIEKKWAALRAGVEAARTTLHATPFEVDSAAKAFTEENRRYETYRTAMQDMLIEIAGRISAAGREQLSPSRRFVSD